MPSSEAKNNHARTLVIASPFLALSVFLAGCSPADSTVQTTPIQGQGASATETVTLTTTNTDTVAHAYPTTIQRCTAWAKVCYFDPAPIVDSSCPHQGYVVEFPTLSPKMSATCVVTYRLTDPEGSQDAGERDSAYADQKATTVLPSGATATDTIVTGASAEWDENSL